MLFREFTFCECGRPAINGSRECRTCYEDALRRAWREESRHEASLRACAPLTIVRPAIRTLYALSDEDAQRETARARRIEAAREEAGTVEPAECGTK